MFSSCQQKEKIVEGDAMMKINNISVALEGYKMQCGCLKREISSY
ncbi:PAAR domain-containing protein [Proteus alimentorum]